MAHYAKVEHGIVTQVIVAEQDFIDSGLVGSPEMWIQTSYNTRGGKHLLGGTPLRKNFAGIGSIYDSVNDAFLPPKPYESWVIDEEIWDWVAPVPLPEDNIPYTWDDSLVNWVPIPSPFPSWVIGGRRMWLPPVPFPDDGNQYTWNEENLAWDLYTPPIPNQPFPSWVLVDRQWEPPHPPPEPRMNYIWNEYDLTWIRRFPSHPSWRRNEITGHWEAPIPKPESSDPSEVWVWVEQYQQWGKVVPE